MQISPLDVMGYHLQCDVSHDFGPSAPVYNINGSGAAARVGATTISEDGCVAFFTGPLGNQLIADFAARYADQVTFTVPDKTSSFENWKAPLLFLGGNENIGIIQDAGEFITQRLGAKNVLTFGSILDPAGKPIRPDQQPIWYEPAVNDVTIPLAPFGFDPAVIQAIRIRSLTAGTVKAEFVTAAQTLDAVAMSPPLAPIAGGKAKPINQTKVELAGFFTSIEKANNLREELTIAGMPKPVIDQIMGTYMKNFFIGKTLGDTMLVASGLPMLPGLAVANPYYNVGAAGGAWKSWSNGSPAAAPRLQILKTGDRLNWLRAIIFNLGAIYEQQAKGARKTKQYLYFPGTANPDAVRTALLADFDKIKGDVFTRYKGLRDSLEELMLPGTRTVNPAKTPFAPGGMQTVRGQIAPLLAGRLLTDIQTALWTQNGAVVGGLCKDVLDWIDQRKVVAERLTTVEQLRSYYQETVDRANACSPPSTSITVKKGKQDPYLMLKCIVVNVPQDAVRGEAWPFASSIDIALRNAFAKFEAAREVTEAEYTSRLSGTDIQNRFIEKLPGRVGGAQRGGATAALDIASINATVDEVVGPIAPSPGIEVDGPPGAQRGGAFITPEVRYPLDEFTKVLQDSFPRLYDFMEYAQTLRLTGPQVLVLVYDIIRRRTTNRIVDPVLLESLIVETASAMGMMGGTPYLTFKNGDPAVFTEGYVVPKDTPSSNATVIFDAYTYYVNGRNALDGETVTQSAVDFHAIELAYLSKIGLVQLRSGRVLLPAPVMGRRARGGDVRRNARRRTTHQRASGLQQAVGGEANADAGSSFVDGRGGRRGLYTRLRKRSRPRRTARLRQPARKSRTRRQRKSLDRL